MLLTVLLVSLLCSISAGFNTFRGESLLTESSSSEPAHPHLPAHQFSALLYSLQQDTEAAQPAEGLHLLPWSVFLINIFRKSCLLLIFIKSNKRMNGCTFWHCCQSQNIYCFIRLLAIISTAISPPSPTELHRCQEPHSNEKTALSSY